MVAGIPFRIRQAVGSKNKFKPDDSDETFFTLYLPYFGGSCKARAANEAVFDAVQVGPELDLTCRVLANAKGVLSLVVDQAVEAAAAVRRTAAA